MINIPGKIPIRIYPLFWFLIAIIGWVNSGTIFGTAVWAVIILFSVLIHEYGHALTAIAFGQNAHIELVGLGGVTHRQGERLPLWKEFIVILNGPLAGFLLAGIAFEIVQLMGPGQSLAKDILKLTVLANIFWGVVNLLPIHPLDGGRLFSIILEWLFGNRGVKIALFISGLLSIVICLFFFAIGSLLAGSLFLLLAFESFRAWKSSLDTVDPLQDNSIQVLLKQAEEDLRYGRNDAAQEKLQEIRQMNYRGSSSILATEALAHLYYRQGRSQEAYDLLKEEQKFLSPDAFKLLHQLAFRNQHWKEAVEIGNRAYQTYPNYETALTNALCYASLGEERPTMGWLQRAINDGLPDVKAVLNRKEFDYIRNSSTFRDLENKSLSSGHHG